MNRVSARRLCRAGTTVVWLWCALTAACTRAAPDRDLLERSWAGYRSRFVAEDGRVVRPEHTNDTVSEGQAYTMLRAVWMGDRPTFDRVWRWSLEHLARHGREQPSLWAWRWTPADGGAVVDWNVATDADTDAALALLMASDRWPTQAPGLPQYGAAARAMLADLAVFAVADEDGTVVMLPGAWADQRSVGQGLVLNPSYLSPAAYRVFARETSDPRWSALATGAYVVLGALCRGHEARPIPDWIRWRSHGRWQPEGDTPISGWDAIRVPWRVATDVLWFGAPDARRFLAACIEPAIRAATATGHGLAVERDLEGRDTGALDHPLANALHAMAAARPADRAVLLERVRSRVVTRGSGAFFDDPDHYYVNSLAYLPFLARTAAYAAPRPPAR